MRLFLDYVYVNYVPLVANFFLCFVRISSTFTVFRCNLTFLFQERIWIYLISTENAKKNVVSTM